MSVEIIVTNLLAEIDRIVDQKVASLPQWSSASVDEETRKQIAQHELIAHKALLNKKETALYLGCSERSVEEWAARAVKDNPLPVGYAGNEMRARREALDKWTEGEAQRKRLRLAG